MENRKNLKNIKPLKYNMKDLRKLKPIEFTWKIDNARDVGFYYENVHKITPLLTQRGRHGEDRIKYDKLSLALLNAMKDMDKEICKLKEEIKKLKKKRTK